MKKRLFIILGCVAAIGLLALVTVTFFLGSIIKAGVNRFGPAITKTKVELAGAELSPLTGTGSISGLLIGNPAGWRSDRAVYLGKVALSVAPGSIFGDHIVVREMVIERPEFVYETKLFSSNIRDLMNNIESSSSGDQAASTTAKTKAGKLLKFEVDKFVLREGRVTIGVGASAVTVPLPELTMTDLGTREGGITTSQLAELILGRVFDHVLVTTAGALTGVGKTSGAAATNAAADAAKKAGDEIKKLFGN